MRLIKHQGRTAFYLALGLVPILIWLRNEGIPLSDESYYAHAAVKWLRSGTPTMGSNVFDHRWALIYPMTLIIQWFGTTAITLTAWSTICYAGVVCLTYIWLNKYQPKAAYWSAAILATNPAMIWCAVNISPDVVCTFFMLGAMLLTFTREMGNPWLKGAVVATALTFAFLAKETAVFFGIPLVVFAVGDTIKHRKSSFWIALACTGLVLLGAYLSVYYIYTGNWMHRFDVLNNQYLHRLDDPFSLVGKSWQVRFERLFIRPIPFFLKEPGYIFLLLGLLGVSIKSAWIDATKPIKELYLTLLWVGVYFVLGSVSFTSYTPITLADRMILPLLPFLVISLVTTTSHQSYTRIYPYLVGGLAGLSMLIAIMTGRYLFPFLLTTAFSLILAILHFKKRVRQDLVLGLVLVFQLVFLFFTPRNTEYFTEKKLLMRAKFYDGQPTIATDRRMAELYRSHVDFDSTFDGRVFWWDTLPRHIGNKPPARLWVLENQNRIQSKVIENGNLPEGLNFHPKEDRLDYDDGISRIWVRFYPIQVQID